MDSYTPFCGTPPSPDELMTRWLFDPALLTGLTLLGFILLWRAPNSRSALGFSLVALLFISPLCALSMSLFSARVAQHILLTLVAAPILALALPITLRQIPAQTWVATMVFGALFWLWHSPSPYWATLHSDVMYWTMHLSLVGAAWWLASSVLGAYQTRPAEAILALAITAGQMTLLSAVLLFSSTAWHSWHELTTVSYGLTALADQQLAATFMWTSGGMLMFLAVGLLTYRFVASKPLPDLKRHA